MTDDWREHARRGEWNRTSPLLLSDDDLAELKEMLRRVVPTRKRGHGVETFEGFIRPEEANSEAEYEAALFAQYLMRELERRKLKAAYDCPLDEAIEFAIATLQEHGIKYEGYRKTFLYWRADRSGWQQIPGSVAAAIRTKVNEMWDRMPDPYDAESDMILRRLIAWQTKYPWRANKSLFEVFRADVFETNTPIWHALSIFDWYEQYQDAVDLIGSDDGDYSVEHYLKDAVESAFEIGRNYEALVKKPFEPHAIRGMKTVEAADKGAEATAAITRERTQPRLEKMKELVPKHGVANAARLLAAKGMGSITANRGLWYRRQKK